MAPTSTSTSTLTRIPSAAVHSKTENLNRKSIQSTYHQAGDSFKIPQSSLPRLFPHDTIYSSGKHEAEAWRQTRNYHPTPSALIFYPVKSN